MSDRQRERQTDQTWLIQATDLLDVFWIIGGYVRRFKIRPSAELFGFLVHPPSPYIFQLLEESHEEVRRVKLLCVFSKWVPYK